MNQAYTRKFLLVFALLATCAACAEKNPVPEPEEAFNFSELASLRDQIDEFPPLEPYQARDGATLSFRRYRSEPNVHAILIHGSSSHSVSLHPFAKYLSEKNIANVYAVDLRGHGPSPKRRGDIDYIGQLEDDIADLISHIKGQAPEGARFIVGGHSSGGGMALRFGGSEHGNLAAGILLLAPYLGHNAPMVKKNAGGWADPNLPKIIGLSIMDGFGIKRYNGAKVLRFNLPEKYHTGYETLEYSFRLMRGIHPDSYEESLKNTKSPLLIIVSSDDEAFQAKEFESGILPYKSDAKVSYVEGGSHLGILVSEPAMVEAGLWIEEN